MTQPGMLKQTFTAAGVTVLLAVGALGATSAHAEGSGSQAGGAASVVQTAPKAKGTPDGWGQDQYIKNHRYATVYWDDYTSDGADVDSLTINDADLDGRSSQLRVYKSKAGKLWKKVHARSGGSKTIDVSIKRGQKIYFKVCGYNNGANTGCTGKQYFRE